MKVFDYENYVKNLPDCLNKLKDSNNYKILETVRQSLDGLFVDMQSVIDSLDIENAKGETLDLYGDMLGQPRGLATDDQYRLLIKSKILMNFTNGSYKSIVNALCVMLDCQPSEIYIRDTDNPCTVEMAMLPLDVVNRAGLTTKQIMALVDRLLPVGVHFETFLFEGTFVFTELYGIATTTQGFASDDGTIEGGYLGVVNGEEDETVLPI